ncbi:MAG: M18 family aminopeptidase [Deltaproteobacteria bacterium]|jgi:aspartyl aminopeptidase|nr:M18 family aminopeptidase [Deltaproteobacteria bacterium]MBT4263585.1 M18 family aminopeptidase [Deltaproteobacteria bacterium]MBT4644336.1 M18 family aminopeptidase [Deltaproteobacteria bacterium]MBT6500417.1 M18 family aminopeptidase [Deltaproteobacteria bacterium]MBT7152543.1 M18 family aminopeptidase [Deltaproteobacteria bacterium]
MTKQQIIKKLIQFLVASPTPFHAVKFMTALLNDCGYTELAEADSWRLKKGGGYYLIRGGSSLIAFRLGKNDNPVEGLRIVGAHTDSPVLKIKTNPLLKFKNYLRLGVEVYGSPILNTWFDRDLSIAGRVAYTDIDQKAETALIDFKRAVAVIPNLPIHLTPANNTKEKINRQTELPPILMQFDPQKKSKAETFPKILMAELQKNQPTLKIKSVDDFEVCLYDTQQPTTVGYNNEFFCAGKLDNLVSCFSGLLALTDSSGERTSMLVCNDHEEVGSNSYTGAAGPLLKSVLERVLKNREDYFRALSRSILVSVDNAHGVHPNYPHRYDENHGPILNKGPVLKVNANQRYATNAETGSIFRRICREAKVPVQEFVNRSDLNCGSTIGPITSTNLGIKTLDIGVPTFAMHSIRETCGCQDIRLLHKALVNLFNSPV